jgi:hypothetical protein
MLRQGRERLAMSFSAAGEAAGANFLSGSKTAMVMLVGVHTFTASLGYVTLLS